MHVLPGITARPEIPDVLRICKNPIEIRTDTSFRDLAGVLDAESEQSDPNLVRVA